MTKNELLKICKISFVFFSIASLFTRMACPPDGKSNNEKLVDRPKPCLDLSNNLISLMLVKQVAVRVALD